MNQSWMERRSRRDWPWPSTVYQRTCPTPVASGPSVGTTPPGSALVSRFSRSSTREGAKYKSTWSSKITLIIEKPKAEEDRTTRTPGRPCRLTVSGEVIWSSTSWGDRPGQSVKTITWLSDRSGIASIGVVSSAQYPQPARSRNAAITRTRFRSEISISQLIIGTGFAARLHGSRRPAEPADHDPDQHCEGPDEPETQQPTKSYGYGHERTTAHIHHLHSGSSAALTRSCSRPRSTVRRIGGRGPPPCELLDRVTSYLRGDGAGLRRVVEAGRSPGGKRAIRSRGHGRSGAGRSGQSRNDKAGRGGADVFAHSPHRDAARERHRTRAQKDPRRQHRQSKETARSHTCHISIQEVSHAVNVLPTRSTSGSRS